MLQGPQPSLLKILRMHRIWLNNIPSFDGSLRQKRVEPKKQLRYCKSIEKPR